jgi:4-amino-4-deoxy-L-arabinose transferase-like glycosyltransferase
MARPVALLKLAGPLALGFIALLATLWSITKSPPNGESVLIALAWLSSAACLWWYAGRRNFLIVAGSIAVGFRLAVWLMAAGGYPPTSDPAGYMQLARTLLATGELRISLDWIGDTRALFPPVYPLLLASVMFFVGSNLAAPIILNAAIHLATALALYRLARPAGASQAKAISAIYLIWPTVLLGSTWAQKEGLTAFWVVCILHACFRICNAVRPMRWAMAFGVCTGLLALTQPSLSFVPGAMLLAVCMRKGLTFVIKVAAIGIAAFILIMLPWWIRNYVVLGGFVPLTTSSGVGLYYMAMHQVVIPPEIIALPEIERTNRLAAVAFETIQGDFPRYLSFVGKRFLVQLTIDTEVLQDFRSIPGFRLNPDSLALTLQLAQAALWTAVAGLAWRSRADAQVRTAGLIITASLATLCLFGPWFEFGPRHRQFLLVPALLLIAAAAPRLRLRTS